MQRGRKTVKAAARSWPNICPSSQFHRRPNERQWARLPLAGLADAIAHQRYRLVQTSLSLPIGSWRSVDSSHSGFFVEAFVDEIAAAINRDPVDFWRVLLAGQPRHLETLNLVVARSGYGPGAPDRTADAGARARGRIIGMRWQFGGGSGRSVDRRPAPAFALRWFRAIFTNIGSR